MNQYEAMFLFDPTVGASFENCETEIRRLMGRAEAELLFCKKWDERRLAYKIKGRKRGVFVLTYFKAKPGMITPLERDVHISESVLRVLVLRADGVTPEMMEEAVETKGAAAGGDDDHGYSSYSGPSNRGRSAPAEKKTAEPAAVVAATSDTAPDKS